jgi:integrase
MARITRPLTNNEILKAKPREKDFPLHDGDGLFLLVKTSGKKLWRSPQALDILEVMKPISAHREHVFPSRNDPKKAMNSQTANAALKRIGYGGRLVAHGLRSIASTAMNEANFNPDVIEAALAHTNKNEVRRAYNRSTYLVQRRDLIHWWGSFVKQ